MKITLKIARTELRNLFYSPVAWFLTLVFLVMCAVLYTGAVETSARMQDVAQESMPKFKGFGVSLTKQVFIDGGIFKNILHNLYLFIPLLTMGVISREMTNGTVKLLYSSPIKIRQIVLGKYLAIMTYNMVLLSIVMIFIVTGIINIQSADYGKLLAGGLGFYLLVCAYTAFGVFMSSLTNYQVVSALATFTVIFILNQIGSLWQQFDFVRDLTFSLSLSGRTQMMLNGLITTKDVIYFILIVGMFISFTILRLKFARLLLPWYKKTAAYIGVFLVALTLGYLTSRPGYIGYWDTTAGKGMTIHPKTQQILESLGKDPVEVTLYTNLLGAGVQRTLPNTRQDYVWNFWDPYVRFKPNMHFKYVLYYDQKDDDSSLYKTFRGKNIHEIAENVSDIYGYSLRKFLPPVEIRKMINLQPEDCRAVMQLTYKGRSTFLRTFQDPKFWPNEDHVAAAFKVLAEGKGPKMYFLTGHFERSIHKRGQREYNHITTGRRFRSALINHGYNIDTLTLENKDIPEDAEVLVLADPKSDLSEVAQHRIGQYLKKGGNMIFLGEPGKQEMLNPVLRPLGVQLGNGTVVEITKDEMPHIAAPYITWAATDLGEDPMLVKQKDFLARGLDTMRLEFPGTANVEIADSGFTVKHLMVTKDRNAWVKTGKLVVDSAAPVFHALDGDYHLDSASTLISLSRKIGNKEQRIVVGGDADFISQAKSLHSFIWSDFNSWIDHNDLPVLIPHTPAKDVLFRINNKTAKVQRIIYVWILPGVLLLFGTVLLIRRKRK